MRKLVSLFLLGICAVALASEPAHAASELETWCIAQGAGWQAANDRCLLLAATHATVSGTLALLPNESVSNYGTITNAGEIDSGGIIDNFGTLTNHGHVRNDGWISNYTHGRIYNYGTIANEGTMANYDTIRNYGTMTNTDTINNWGTIYNLCAGVIGPQPPLNQPGGVIYDLNNCCFLSVVARD
jgi:hypothetical protein